MHCKSTLHSPRILHIYISYSLGLSLYMHALKRGCRCFPLLQIQPILYSLTYPCSLEIDITCIISYLDNHLNPRAENGEHRSDIQKEKGILTRAACLLSD